MTDDDPLRRRMRAADPAASVPPADPSRVARLLEGIMNDTSTATSPTRATSRRPAALLVAAAAVVAGAVGLWAIVGDDPATPPAAQAPQGSGPQEPAALELQAPTATPARCARPTPDILRNAEIAFDGVVTARDGRRVTLSVSRWFRGGGDTETVEVAGPSAAVRALLQAVDFRPEGRYLVTAVDGQVTLCGLSDAYSADLAAAYAEAFGG